MEFRLYYRGPLPSNGSVREKQHIRNCFHMQLNELWKQKPLADYYSDKEGLSKIFSHKEVGDYRFLPLVCAKAFMIAELDIIMLRPEEPGGIITQAGDIDNRLKTLFDALRMPHNSNEIIEQDLDQNNELIYCLLEDDNLITRVSVDTDRLLEPVDSQSEVILMIKIQTKLTKTVIGNVGL